MAATTDVIIRRWADDIPSEKFLFRCVTPFTPRKAQPVLNVNLPNGTAANNLIFRFMGQVEEVNFTFVVFNDGVDISDGTHPSTVKTVAEQVKYLKDNVFTPEFDTYWFLQDEHNLIYPSSTGGIQGVITGVEFPMVTNATVMTVGTLTFMRGKIAAL